MEGNVHKTASFGEQASASKKESQESPEELCRIMIGRAPLNGCVGVEEFKTICLRLR